MTEEETIKMTREVTRAKLELEQLRLQNKNLTIMDQFSRSPWGIEFHSNNLRLAVIAQEIKQIDDKTAAETGPAKDDNAESLKEDAASGTTEQKPTSAAA